MLPRSTARALDRLYDDSIVIYRVLFYYVLFPGMLFYYGLLSCIEWFDRSDPERGISIWQGEYTSLILKAYQFIRTFP